MAVTEQQKAASFDRTLASARSTLVFSEVVRLAVDSFRASKVRFLLTMLGMIIGSASIVLVVTLGLTGKQFALDQLSSIAPNMVEMQFYGGSVAGPDNTTTPDYMTREDMNAVIEQVPGIVASSPMLEFHESISIGSGVTKDTMILGVSAAVQGRPQPPHRRRPLLRRAGHRSPTPRSPSSSRPSPKPSSARPHAAIGHTITISGIPFVIIGVAEMRIDVYGQSELSDQTILIPYPVARYFTGTDTVKEIFFSMKQSSDVVPASKRSSTSSRAATAPTPSIAPSS